jgi:flagellar biosynthesis protein FlhB
MSSENDQDKTEPATSKKLEDARKKGQVANSREITSVAVLLSAMMVFYFAGNWMFMQVGEVMRDLFTKAGFFQLGFESAHVLLWYLFKKVIIIIMPLLLVVAVAGIFGNVAQVGFMMTGETLVPKLSKINPIEGIKRLFSLKGLIELIKSILKVIIIGGMAYILLRSESEQIPALIQLSLTAILSFVGHIALKLGFYTCMVLIVLAGVDFVFQRWQHAHDLRMTKQEIKDENKQSQGDPMVKSRIRAIQREMAMRRMMDQVPEATMVITNPTHLAVVLKFTRDMQAPLVVAKGANKIAERIKSIAQAHGVPIIEQKPLARALYKNVEIGHYIPGDLYQAVAEILAYVYRLKGLA